MFGILYEVCTNIKKVLKDYFYPEQKTNISPELMGKMVITHMRQMNNNYLY